MASDPATRFPREVKLPFRPRARLLQLLGDQLIGSPRLAVFELVKNGYDADAETVTVTLRDVDGPDAKIVVEDDGDGMSLETIRDIWLVPAHDHRRIQRLEKRRTEKGRLPLGEKGLGRFAVHKLGDRIELVTRAAGQPECLVSIDWAAMISKPFLSEAEVTVRTRPAQVFKGRSTGTKIRISHLRDVDWTRGEVRRLLRQITSISSPFATRSDRFDAVLRVPDHPDWVAGVPDVEALLARAPWKYHFEFKGGRLEWTYEFRGVPGIRLASRTVERDEQPLLIAPDRDADDARAASGPRPKRAIADAGYARGIGPISGDFYVFDRDRDVLSKLGDSQLVQN